jgi:hypothetical protein
LTFRHAMNGAPVPNWAKLVALGFAIAIQILFIFLGQKEGVTTLIEQNAAATRIIATGQAEIVRAIQHNGEMDSIRAEEGRKQLNGLLRQSDAIHQRMWRALRSPGEFVPLQP